MADRTPARRNGPATPRPQGSILRTLFSPATWFQGQSGVSQSQQPSHNEQSDTSMGEAGNDNDDDDDDDDEEDSSSTDSQDEEEQIGLVSGATIRAHATNSPQSFRLPQTKSQQQTPQLPSAAARTGASPNALLADFFAHKGNTPLSAIEIAGVQALLQGGSTTELITPSHPPSRLPVSGANGASFAVPVSARRPYQPIFTPANSRAGTFRSAATSIRKVSRPGTGVAVGSPFRHRRSGLPIPSASAAASRATANARALDTDSPSTTLNAQGKRVLDDDAAPDAKRRRPAPSSSLGTSPAGEITGQRTADAMLEILNNNTLAPEEDENSVTLPKDKEALKTMLNPYAPAASTRKQLVTPRRQQTALTPQRSAIDEIERSAGYARNATAAASAYKPKQSSALATQSPASASTDTIFSPPKNGKFEIQPKSLFPIATPSAMDDEEEENDDDDKGEETGPAPVKSPTATKPSISSGQDTPTQLPKPALVHQLRDGTEYISPSKPTTSASSASQPASAPPAPAGGFVFKPPTSTTSTTPAFTFNRVPPTTSTTTGGGFVFNPNPQPPPTQKNTSSPPTSSSTPKDRVLALTENELPLTIYDFYVTPSVVGGSLVRERALGGIVGEVNFGEEVAAAAAGGFDWVKAGLAKPQTTKEEWICGVCMCKSPGTVDSCVVCESPRT
ncbi:hypothetical protein PYCC9005_002057 [Savitreella phatthalungensis]